MTSKIHRNSQSTVETQVSALQLSGQVFCKLRLLLVIGAKFVITYIPDGL